MKIRLLDVCAVFSVAFVAWFATFVMECYYHGVDGEARQRKGHSRDHQSPFPGGNNDNIFWFLQVSRFVTPALPCPILPTTSPSHLISYVYLRF